MSAISLGKPATMSSLHGDLFASLGNDGDIATRHKFFHTKKELNPWWKVDLEAETSIKSVLLYDRLNHGERSKSLVVEVSSDDQNYAPIYDRNGVVKSVKSVTNISWRGRARYVRARLQGEDYLHLRQIAVVEDEFGK